MPNPQDSLIKQLARYNLSSEDFEALSAMSFDDVLDNIQRSVASGGNIGLPFEMDHNSVLDKFQQKQGKLTKAERIMQILCDRPMQSYLIRYFLDGHEKELRQRTNVKGLEHLQDAAKQRRNICLLNSHFGCGQLIPIVLGQFGFKITSLSYVNRYRQVGQNDPKNVKVFVMQDAFPAKILATGLQAFKAGQIVHMAPDAQKGSSGQTYDFFGRQRRFANGFGYFGVRADAVCLPIFCAINAMGRMTITIEPPLEKEPGGSAADNIDHLTGQYVEALKARWLSHPANIMPHVLFRHVEKQALKKAVKPKPNKKPPKTWEQKWSDETFSPVWQIEGIPAEISALLTQERMTHKHRVLDVGCGNGHIAHHLAQHNIAAVGWDIAPSAIAKAKATYIKDGLKLHYAVKNIVHLKNPKARFDWIIDRGCLHTLKGHDRSAYFKNCAALLKSGGQMLILHKNLNNAELSEKTPRQVMREMIRKDSYPFFNIESAERTRFNAKPDGPKGFALILKS